MASSERPSRSSARTSTQKALVSEVYSGSLTTRPAYSAYRPSGPRTGDPFTEIGTSGLRQYGGFVLEEWLQQLQGRKEPWAYREMIDNDPVVGGILFAIKMLARNVQWWAQGHEGKDDERTDFVFECMHDMTQTWTDTICEALSMCGYGWAFSELCYKRRNGPQRDTWSPVSYRSDIVGDASDLEEDSSPASSRYKDGKIGWRKIPVRGQETLLKWGFRGYAGIAGMEQVDWHGGQHFIPIEKALLFRTETTRNNPQGRSLLRNCWVPFYSIKNIQALEAIGIERELAGIPVAIPPDDVEIFSPGYRPLLEEVQKMVTSLRRDEYQGVVLPSGKWKLELMKTGGSRQIDTDTIIRRYEQRIAASVMADFLLVGQDGLGSYAMVDVKSDLFGVAMDTILDLIAEPFNRYAIPRLLALNGMSVENPPEIRHSHAGRIDLEKVGEFFKNLYMAGAEIPWTQELIGQLFTEAGLPAGFNGQALDTTDHPTGQVHPAVRPEASAESDTPAKSGKPDTKVQKAGDLTDDLRDRARILSTQLAGEMDNALAHLGREAGQAYLNHAEKSMSRRDVARVAARVLRRLNIRDWVKNRIEPLLHNHAGRVVTDTQRVIRQELGQEVQIADKDALAIAAKAGSHLNVSDIEPQVREAIMRAIEEGFAAGENPTRTAERIAQSVPPGRFVKAGRKYRSELIARNETAELQRAATLAAYRSMPNVTAVKLRDGIYGPPRSDAECIERDGEIVPIDEVDRVQPFHINCTLGFAPVVG